MEEAKNKLKNGRLLRSSTDSVNHRVCSSEQGFEVKKPIVPKNDKISCSKSDIDETK